jgi:hypothetical protein
MVCQAGHIDRNGTHLIRCAAPARLFWVASVILADVISNNDPQIRLLKHGRVSHPQIMIGNPG